MQAAFGRAPDLCGSAELCSLTRTAVASASDLFADQLEESKRINDFDACICLQKRVADLARLLAAFDSQQTSLVLFSASLFATFSDPHCSDAEHSSAVDQVLQAVAFARNDSMAPGGSCSLELLKKLVVQMQGRLGEHKSAHAFEA